MMYRFLLGFHNLLSPILAAFRMDDSPEELHYMNKTIGELLGLSPEEKPEKRRTEPHRARSYAVETGTITNKNLDMVIAGYSEEQKKRKYLGYEKGVPYFIDYENGDCLIGFIRKPEWTEGTELEPPYPTTIEEIDAYNSVELYHNVFCGWIQEEEITPDYQMFCRDLIRQYLTHSYGCTFNIDRGGYYNHYLLCFQDVPFTEELHKSINKMCREFTQATKYKALPDWEGGIAA